MSEPLQLHIHFLSDWHVGEGAGAQGHIDAIIRRHPADGLPYLPAKTLTGILRDGCERIVFGLDNGDAGGPWHAFLRLLFGSNQEDQDPRQQSAALAIGPARLAMPLRRALAASPALREALVFLKPGVKLDEEGVAESQMLRFEEMAIAGARLSAELTLTLAGPQRDQALALLAAGARTVERLGAKRRRGHGRCQMELIGSPTQRQLLALLRQAPVIAEAPADPHAALVLGPATGQQGSDWRVFALDLRLETPVLVPAATLGNVIATRDHIPGSLLLPALDGWLRRLLGTQTTGALARGAVQIRNAYPAVGPHRLLPVPAALFRRKDGYEITNHLAEEPSDGAQRKQLREGYLAPAGLLPARKPGDPAGLVTVATLAATHATIEDERQRPTGAVGGVFTYEAIQPTQPGFDSFRAELWIAADLLAGCDPGAIGDWCRSCPASLRIGRAKKDDYGQISATCTPMEALPLPATDGTTLTLWLTAPLLLRDAALNPVTDAKALAGALTAALADLIPADKPITLEPLPPAFARPWRDDGWNNAWQMQRSTRFGLAPGSCFRFRANRDIPADVLRHLEHAGLGERRGEGYGEIRVNPPLLRKAIPEVLPAATPPAPARQTSGQIEADEFTEALQRRAARLAIERQVFLLEQAFRRDLGWQRNLPPNPQLGALRALLETLHDNDDRQRIRDWVAAVRVNDRRKDKWPAASLDLLERHLNDDQAIWRQLELARDGMLPLLPGQPAEPLRRHLRDGALRILWLVAISNQLRQNNLSDQAHQTQEAVRGT